MAAVHISNVEVLNNPGGFFTPFKFQLTFECIDKLNEDLEWKMIYVGSAESEEYDQVLETIYVGPVPEGRHTFLFQANAPDVSKIPEADVVGVTIILISCSYRKQEFVRVGYFVNNDYTDLALRENPPSKPIVEQLTRNILATKPRVTRFKINWYDPLPSPTPNSVIVSPAARTISSADLLANLKNVPLGERDANGCFILFPNGLNGGRINGEGQHIKGNEIVGMSSHCNGNGTMVPGVLDC